MWTKSSASIHTEYSVDFLLQGDLYQGQNPDPESGLGSKLYLRSVDGMRNPGRRGAGTGSRSGRGMGLEFAFSEGGYCTMNHDTLVSYCMIHTYMYTYSVCRRGYTLWFRSLPISLLSTPLPRDELRPRPASIAFAACRAGRDHWLHTHRREQPYGVHT